MRNPSRKTWALGLVLAGLAILVGRSHAQNDPGAAKAPNAANALPPARIGTIDMDRVFKEYKKVKFAGDQLKNDVQAKQGELGKLMAQGRQVAQEMESLAPGSGTFKEKEAAMTRLKAQVESERELAQAEFTRREADALATIYKEVQAMTAAVARQQGLTYVMKTSAEPISASEPNSVIAAMNRAVVYSDPSTDITNKVVYYLNLAYEKQVGAQAPAAAPAAAATADAATRPAAATTTAPQRTATRPAPTGAGIPKR